MGDLLEKYTIDKIDNKFEEMGDGKLGENERKNEWIGWWYTPVILEIVLWTAEDLFVVQMTALARINDRAI